MCIRDSFITGLSSHCRDLLVSKEAATLPLLEVGAVSYTHLDVYKRQVQNDAGNIFQFQ